ncbi:uncharacterized protein [Ptychodera flava]|uniref:uncharacterized protein n=1 Tax=Ptychodera flava TaxID=63121 RepID=UPI00396A4DC3
MARGKKITQKKAAGSSITSKRASRTATAASTRATKQRGTSSAAVATAASNRVTRQQRTSTSTGQTPNNTAALQATLQNTIQALNTVADKLMGVPSNPAQNMSQTTSEQQVLNAVQGSLTSITGNSGLGNDARPNNIVQPVQNTVNSVVGGIAQPPDGTGDQPTGVGVSHFTSLSVPLGATLSDKVRQKIWSGGFIEFSALLSKTKQEQYTLCVQNPGDSDTPSFQLVPTEKHIPINSIDKWISAFQVFAAVYTSKFPHEAPALMKYLEVICNLAASGGNWRFYNVNFRLMKQSTPLPWD